MRSSRVRVRKVSLAVAAIVAVATGMISTSTVDRRTDAPAPAAVADFTPVAEPSGTTGNPGSPGPGVPVKDTTACCP